MSLPKLLLVVVLLVLVLLTTELVVVWYSCWKVLVLVFVLLLGGGTLALEYPRILMFVLHAAQSLIQRIDAHQQLTQI